jgi:hypothetical protein
MITYNNARRILADLEQKWFNKLLSYFARRALPVPTMMNGEVQFFSIEYVEPGKDPVSGFSIENAFKQLPNGPLPVIVAVGINYGQDPAIYRFPTHHLSRRSGGATWVEDYTASGMRNVVNAALPHYFNNPATRVSNGYAASPSLVPSLWSGTSVQPYILIATNVSPFLSQKNWGNHTPADQAAVLRAWNCNDHLCDLLSLLGTDIDLWIIHGKQFCWDLFDTSGCIPNWMLLHNLSRRSLRWVGSFWKHPRVLSSVPPIWPKC